MTPKIRKGTSVLLNPIFNTPKTILMHFQFEPHLFPTSLQRMKEVTHHAIENKDLYVFDHFFSPQEVDDLRTFSEGTSFSRKIFASTESQNSGEKAAYSMNGKERWELFSNPPRAIQELFIYFNTLSHLLDAEITTLPWDLCDEKSSSPTIATNFLQSVTAESMQLGKHQDYNPESGLPFAIPNLYGSGHHSQFTNGAPGKPYLLSIILFSTDSSFLPHYGMGTAFYKKDDSLVIPCQDGRMIFFEGDILHSIEKSSTDVKTWRISYVFKIIMNPKNEGCCIKQQLFRRMNALCSKVL